MAPTDDSKTTRTCLGKLAACWSKLSQPEYAIGQNLLLRTDYQALQDSYYSQSLMSIGLMLPLLFLVFAVLVTPEIGMGGRPPLYFLLGAGEVVLLTTGVDRRHKYNTALEGLISGAFLKKCAQPETKPAAAPDPKTVASQIADALAVAKIFRNTDLTIVPGVVSTPGSGAPAAPVPAAAAPAAPGTVAVPPPSAAQPATTDTGGTD
jgi:hypothetical protein